MTTMSSDARPCITPQLVIGVFITLAGVLLTLDRLNLIAISFFRFWPSVLIAVGASMLIQRRDSSGRFWGTTWVVLGSWMLLNSLGVLRLRFWELLGPALLILIGWSIVSKTLHPDPPATAVPPATPGYVPVGDIPPMPDAGAQTRAGRDPGMARSHEGGRVNLVAVMGEAKRASNDNPFRGGEMTAVMGGCVLDLRQALVAPGEEARLNLVGLMAGHEIWVPPGWAVMNDVVPILGGTDDKRLPPLTPLPANPPRLRLRGMMIMGGVVIKN
jgi:hypothetical protein